MKLKKNHLIIVVTIALIIFAVVLSNAVFYAPSDEIPLPLVSIGIPLETSESASLQEEAVKKVPKGYPIALSIPKINVNADIQKVGITAKGNMATPRSFRNVGWYKYGTVPGNIGSAVIAGHVDNGLSLPAVFSKLSNLKEGDDIYITTDENKRLHFRVTGSEIYDFNENVPEIFRIREGKILRLITCTGAWLKEYRTHDERLVVSAVLVE
ncbi:MAG: class F sortase [Minisyncoccia bacterium]